MKYLFILLSLISLFSCIEKQKNQAKFDKEQNFYISKIYTINPSDNQDTSFLPILHSKNNENIAEQIKKQLFQDALMINYSKDKKKLLKSIYAIPEGWSMSSLGFLNYSQNILNNKIYSISINGEFTSAYSEPFEITDNFDLLTGKKILFDNLITPKGKQLILQKMNNHKIHLIDSVLQNISQLLKTEKSIEDIEQYNEMEIMFKSCLEDSLISVNDYKVFENHIEINFGRCSAHVDRALDVLWDFMIKLPFDKYQNYFSKYGKTILNP